MAVEELEKAFVELEENKVYEMVRRKLEAGTPSKDLLAACQNGMKEVGERYQKEEYFVADMMFAGEIMRQTMNILEPHLGGQTAEKAGKVVIGTVKGDIHDIGKDVVIIALQGNGFEVIDLGVDVPAQKFVQAVKQNNAHLVGMSVFLTSCFESAGNVVKAIKDAGLRHKVKIMIGGAPVTGMAAEQTGCDFHGENAAAGVKFALKAVGAS